MSRNVALNAINAKGKIEDVIGLCASVSTIDNVDKMKMKKKKKRELGNASVANGVREKEKIGRSRGEGKRDRGQRKNSRKTCGAKWTSTQCVVVCTKTPVAHKQAHIAVLQLSCFSTVCYSVHHQHHNQYRHHHHRLHRRRHQHHRR